MQERLRYCYALVRNQLKQCAERRKKYYDLKVKPKAKFRPGQFVFYFTPRKIINKCNKWVKNFTGPYLVVRIIEPVNVVIQKSRTSKLMTVHIDKLKLYQGPELKSWIVFPNSVETEEINECKREPVKINKEQEFDSWQ